MCTLFLRCSDAFLVSLAESLSRWLWFFCIVALRAQIFLRHLSRGGREIFCVHVFFSLAHGSRGGRPGAAQMVEASRARPVRAEQLNLQAFQPVAPALQNKWDFNSIRVRLLWPPHGRNYWTYPPPSWNTPTRAVLDPHTDTGVVLHIAEFLHSLASQSCFTLSLVFCSLSAAALLSLSLHHTTPFSSFAPFLFLSLFLFSWGVARLPQNPHISLEEFLMKTIHGNKSKLCLQEKKIVVLINIIAANHASPEKRFL